MSWSWCYRCDQDKVACRDAFGFVLMGCPGCGSRAFRDALNRAEAADRKSRARARRRLADACLSALDDGRVPTEEEREAFRAERQEQVWRLSLKEASP